MANVIYNVHGILADLRSCSMKRDLLWGRRIHAKALRNLNDSNTYVETALIKMYVKCGSMGHARHVFDSIQKPDVVSWTSMLLGYADTGEGHVALDLFSKMKTCGCTPDSVTHVAALKACTSLAVKGYKGECLERGRQIHLDIGCHLNHYVENTLIDMYTKCGSMVEARRVFDNIDKPDVVAWTALIMGYVLDGKGRAGLDLFLRMKEQGCAPNSVTYVAALRACTTLAVKGDSDEKHNCLERGRQIHSDIGCLLDHNLQNTLIDMYSKCGSMEDARRVFDGLDKPHVVAWTVLIRGYAEIGEGIVALDLFSRMKASRCSPDSVAYVAALKACTSLAVNGDSNGCLERGRKIHSEIGCHLDYHVQSTLIDMYSKCGNMPEARRVFESICKPDVVAWNALLQGYTEAGEEHVALEVFSKMKACGCIPDSVSYVAVLKACIYMALKGDKEGCLERGRQIHLEVGCHLNYYVEATLIDMYSKGGCMMDARRLFDSINRPNAVTWTTLLLGYADNGEGHVALDLFSRMKASGCAPDSVSYVAALKACIALLESGDGIGKKYCLDRGREIHSEIGCHMDSYVQNTLVDMYAKCGSMVDARMLFDSIQKPNVMAWTALLMGYAERGEGYAGLDLFSRMKASGCVPDSVAYVAALKACTALAMNGDVNGCLQRGREIHSEIGCHMGHYVQGTLIDMYAKCGRMLEARRVFDSILNPDVVSWSALLLGYAENGEGQAVLDLFSRMKEQGLVANSVTYVAVLKACVLTGSLVLGRKLHSEMYEFNAHVVTCLVDFYAKCGSMVEAREVFDLHSRLRGLSSWTALMAGYGSVGDSDSVFNLFKAMQDEGLRPDSVTFMCLLLCCSHAGFIEKAREYFETLPVQYGLPVSILHYNCMVDVLGRANQLNEAIAMIRKMPFNPDAVTWLTLLGACRRWKNVEIGRMAFQSLDKKDGFSHVLMAHIHGSGGMWEEQLENFGDLKLDEAGRNLHC